MRNEDEYQEWIEDMRRESWEDERREAEMRRDYEDGFLPHIEAEIETVVEGIRDIVNQHTAYGWEADNYSVLELLKDYV